MDVPLTWMLMRATGTIALAALTIAVVVGLVGPRLRPTSRLATVSIHRAAAATGTVLIIGHVVFALADQFVSIDLPAVLVPGASQWERFGVGLGAVAIDLLAVLVITSLIRFRIPRLWRSVHRVAVPMWLVTWWHAVSVGTDAPSASGRAVAVASFSAVAVALAARLTAVGPAGTTADPDAVPTPVGNRR